MSEILEQEEVALIDDNRCSTSVNSLDKVMISHKSLDDNDRKISMAFDAPIDAGDETDLQYQVERTVSELSAEEAFIRYEGKQFGFGLLGLKKIDETVIQLMADIGEQRRRGTDATEKD